MEFIKRIEEFPLFIAAIIFLSSLFFYLSLNSLTDWRAVSTDTVNIGWSIEKLKVTGEIQPFWINEGGYHPSVQRDPVYPALQRFVVALTPFTSDGIVSYLFVTAIIASMVPVGIYFIVRQWTQDSWLLLFSIITTWGSFLLLRSFFLTPQNHLGFLGIIFSSLFLIRYYKKESWLDASLALVFFIATFIFHELSGVILGIVLFFALFLEIHKRLGWLAATALGALVLFLSIVFFIGSSDLFPLVLEKIATYTFVGTEGSPVHKYLWELPVPIGYPMSFLAIIALLSAREKKLPKELQKYLVVYALPVLLLTQLHFFGVYYFIPYRFLAFLWIPVVLLAVYGLRLLLQSLFNHTQKNLKRLFVLFTCLVILASTFNNAQSYASTYGEMVHLSENHLKSFYWFSAYAQPTENVLTSTYGSYEKILYLPFYFDGKIVRYQNSDYDYSPIEQAKVHFNNVSWLGTGLKRFFPETYQEIEKKNELAVNRKMEVYKMITRPDDKDVRVLMDDYGIQYIWFERNMVENRFFEKSDNYHIAYENGTIVIYEREK